MSEPLDDAKTARSSWAARRTSSKPKAISLAQDQWVKTSVPAAEGELPLLIEPQLKSVDLLDWARNNGAFIKSSLLKHGGLFFRGFGLRDEGDFHRFLEAVDADLMYYTEGATPRTKVAGKIYTSTEFPSDQSIAPHNELNYVTTWPMKIWFFCVTAPEVGGETPMVDVRRVWNRLPEEVREPFLDKGWMLVRNFMEGFGLPWQASYRCETREEFEAYLEKADVQGEWINDKHLRTRQVRPAVARHGETGETCWFNHVAFWHVSSLEASVREIFLRDLGEDNLPYNTYYGDGSRIEDSVVEILREAYRQELVAIPWQEGDVMMLDNMLVAHGRHPFQGPRKILTAMAQPCSDRNL
jgi:alpha-ketoglutarate-dependent taurine dioxygenase